MTSSQKPAGHAPRSHFRVILSRTLAGAQSLQSLLVAQHELAGLHHQLQAGVDALLSLLLCV